jgi:Lipocalin-like domain
MMKVLLTTVLLAVSFSAHLALAQSASPAPTVAQLVGTWQLVSVEDTIAGKVQPSALYGPHPLGFLMYEPDGHMCATLTNGDRPGWKDPATPSDAEKIAYYDSFFAYCGTYKLDSQKSVVTHYPTIAWTPEYVGSTQPRPFRLKGGQTDHHRNPWHLNPRS